MVISIFSGNILYRTDFISGSGYYFCNIQLFKKRSMENPTFSNIYKQLKLK